MKSNLFVVLLLTCNFFLLNACASHSDNDQGTNRLVDVGGYSLNFVLKGNYPSELSVVFESGQGCDSSQWNQVINLMAGKTLAGFVSYDRAGFGNSDFGPENYAIGNEVRALERGLESLGITGDIIFVAHSYGGFLAQIFIQRHTDRVKGVVLADPNNYCFNENGGFSALWKPPFDEVSEANRRVLLAYPDTVTYMAGVAQFPKGLPLAVISHGKPMFPTQDLEDLWHSCLQEMAGYAGGSYAVDEKSGHNIPTEDPSIIAQAVLDMINSLRRWTRGGERAETYGFDL
jgi:pimeloyl-ACP methyl ester carboxylesterase